MHASTSFPVTRLQLRSLINRQLLSQWHNIPFSGNRQANGSFRSGSQDVFNFFVLPSAICLIGHLIRFLFEILIDTCLGWCTHQTKMKCFHAESIRISQWMKAARIDDRPDCAPPRTIQLNFSATVAIGCSKKARCALMMILRCHGNRTESSPSCHVLHSLKAD